MLFSRLFFSSFFFLSGIILSHAQGKEVKFDSIALETQPDQNYREDQIYLSLTYNVLANLPDGVKQTGFSGGIHMGLIRDMPINKRRNWAIGVGLGFSMNVFNNNLFVGENQQGKTIFKPIDRNEIDYDVNRFSTFLVEAPIQLRWRTSTADTYRFWRIYAGVRLGYVFYFKSRFQQSGNEVVQTQVNEFDRVRYGLTFTFGYNTFNFHVYYSLNSFFNDQKGVVGLKDGALNTFKVGLMFFIF